MAGNNHNSKREHESKIEFWMRTVIRDGGVDRYDDLHLDRIDKRWKDSKAWISAGLYVYDLALGIRDREQLPFSVVLGFSLGPRTQHKEVNFGATADIERELGTTPPSLYLFRPGQEPWKGVRSKDVITKEIDGSILGSALRSTGCFYLEFRSRSDEEYVRSILVAG